MQNYQIHFKASQRLMLTPSSLQPVPLFFIIFSVDYFGAVLNIQYHPLQCPKHFLHYLILC